MTVAGIDFKISMVLFTISATASFFGAGASPAIANRLKPGVFAE